MGETSLAKIAIAKQADEELDRMVMGANDGFNGGRVTKSDLATWVIQYFAAHSFTGCLKKIREDHFNKVAYLDALVKKLKASGQEELSAEDLSALQTVVTQKDKKKSRSEPKPDVIPEESVG